MDKPGIKELIERDTVSEWDRLRAENAKLTAECEAAATHLYRWKSAYFRTEGERNAAIERANQLQREQDVAISRAEKAEAECEALRADVVWIFENDVQRSPEAIYWFDGPQADHKRVVTDGSPTDILRAVREARER